MIYVKIIFWILGIVVSVYVLFSLRAKTLTVKYLLGLIGALDTYKEQIFILSTIVENDKQLSALVALELSVCSYYNEAPSRETVSVIYDYMLSLLNEEEKITMEEHKEDSMSVIELYILQQYFVNATTGKYNKQNIK